jgi:NAD(P)-dependent dehydrogenase (short-subunit alcohol dehydrogenase family)
MAGICEGRVVIVTGAGRGIGRGHALEFARQGAKVVVNDLGAEVDGTGSSTGPAGEVVEEIRRMGAEAVANGDDVSDWEGAQRLVNTAVETFGGLDVLVNNAGILRDRMLVNMTPEEWDAVVKVHLRGTFGPSRWAATYWRERAKEGQTNDARIINTSSPSGIYGNAGQANYGAAKAGITSLTLTAARALGRYGVRANAIAPRARTAMTADVFGDAPALEAGQIDELSPEHVVTLVRFLSSPAAEGVNGQLFIVYGPTVTLVAAPVVERHFTADADAWDVGDLGSTLHEYFADRNPELGFSATELMSSRD